MHGKSTGFFDFITIKLIFDETIIYVIVTTSS